MAKPKEHVFTSMSNREPWASLTTRRCFVLREVDGDSRDPDVARLFEVQEVGTATTWHAFEGELSPAVPR